MGKKRITLLGLTGVMLGFCGYCGGITGWTLIRQLKKEIRW